MLIIGILLLYFNFKSTCKPKKVEYRYLPRTLNAILEDQAFSSENIITTHSDSNGSWLTINK